MHARTWFDLYRLDEETTRRRTPQSWRLELPKLQVFLQYPTEFFAELLLSLGRVQDNVLYRNRQCVKSWCVSRNHPWNTDAGKVDNCVYRNRSVSCRKCIFRSFALTIRQMSRWKTGISHAGSQHFEDASIRGIPQSCDFLQNYCVGVRTYRGRTKSLIGQSTGLKRY